MAESLDWSWMGAEYDWSVLAVSDTAASLYGVGKRAGQADAIVKKTEDGWRLASFGECQIQHRLDGHVTTRWQLAGSVTNDSSEITIVDASCEADPPYTMDQMGAFALEDDDRVTIVVVRKKASGLERGFDARMPDTTESCESRVAVVRAARRPRVARRLRHGHPARLEARRAAAQGPQ